MCGIIGLLLANKDQHVNQLLFDGLTVLQHRGQDAAGMVTIDKQDRLRLRKDNGLVRDVFQQQHMLELQGPMGIGHVRYPTAGSSSQEEAQPFLTNYPLGIGVAHNGNLTNTDELQSSLKYSNFRHVNTDSDSEVLLNVFAESLTNELLQAKSDNTSQPFRMQDVIFGAMEKVMTSCQGGYAGCYLINGFGLVGFRDPNGIRPLVFGVRKSGGGQLGEVLQKGSSDSLDSISDQNELDYCIASESVAIDTLGFKLVRDVRAGEAIFIDLEGNCYSKVVHANPRHTPCIFEYVYFARPDSIMDGVSVYEARLNMGEKLAEKILRQFGDNHNVDVVIPVPDTSRTSALQAAYRLNVPFREGFMKNRYIGRTFIMPGQEKRKKSVRLKLNTIRREFEGKNVLLVDDSIVRGTTAGEIVQMARDAGAKNVYLSSAAPPIRYPNIYGIDLPSQKELIAFERNEEEIAAKIGCEWVVYQDQADLEESVNMAIPPHMEKFDGFDCSTFDGIYVTGQRMGDDYFTKLHSLRNDDAKATRNFGSVRSPSTLGGTDSPTMPKHTLDKIMVDGPKSSQSPQRELDHAMRVLEKRRMIAPSF
ncbi:amidophosphoribosyltransferase [Nitzschia inconspicua]|uniref:Amidophosphoribosyltransferase n=1 Tax=Nitzschia inconspicua TaxID=303405 RepID=A0A9K3Q426_9STRA|nr:amidophosphoribosyltransferase [Nitzschia inconspicua]KAG7370408.1 amidophosphoribosyltransferase [Nitzschia inconspicua]